MQVPSTEKSGGELPFHWVPLRCSHGRLDPVKEGTASTSKYVTPLIFAMLCCSLLFAVYAACLSQDSQQ